MTKRIMTFLLLSALLLLTATTAAYAGDCLNSTGNCPCDQTPWSVANSGSTISACFSSLPAGCTTHVITAYSASVLDFTQQFGAIKSGGTVLWRDYLGVNPSVGNIGDHVTASFPTTASSAANANAGLQGAAQICVAFDNHATGTYEAVNIQGFNQ